MIVTVFRSRLKEGAEPEYLDWARRISDIAVTMPGYVSHKGFVAADGERVTIVEFADDESHRAWASHPEHIGAKIKGRQSFYADYSVQVCRVERRLAMVHPTKAI